MVESVTFILQQYGAGFWILCTLVLIVGACATGDNWNADKVTKYGLLVATTLVCVLMVAVAYSAVLKAEAPLTFWWTMTAFIVSIIATATASFAAGCYFRRRSI